MLVHNHTVVVKYNVCSLLRRLFQQPFLECLLRLQIGIRGFKCGLCGAAGVVGGGVVLCKYSGVVGGGEDEDGIYLVGLDGLERYKERGADRE